MRRIAELEEVMRAIQRKIADAQIAKSTLGKNLMLLQSLTS